MTGWTPRHEGREERGRRWHGTGPGNASDPDAVAAAAHRVRDALGGLDVMVFSAGHWKQMRVRQFDAAIIRRHLEVNVAGLANAVQAVLPSFLDQRQGRIVGIASLAGYRGLPAAAPYGSSKAAMINLLESLRVDLRGTGVERKRDRPGARSPVELPQPTSSS